MLPVTAESWARAHCEASRGAGRDPAGQRLHVGLLHLALRDLPHLQVDHGQLVLLRAPAALLAGSSGRPWTAGVAAAETISRKLVQTALLLSASTAVKSIVHYSIEYA